MNGKTRVYRYKDFTVVESDGGKVLKSENANYSFNKKKWKYDYLGQNIRRRR